MQRHPMMTWAAGIVLMCASFGLMGFLAAVAARSQFTQLDGVLLQIVFLVVGLAGSFIVGRQSARVAARELIKPHARSAFRRLVALYKSLSRLAMMVESARQSCTPDSASSPVLDKLGAVVEEQIWAADDAMEDWRDIDPEDVQELWQRIHDPERREG